MAIGIEKASTDLDSIFAQLVSGMTAASNAGIRYSASDIDLSVRYAPLTYAAAATTGWQVSPNGVAYIGIPPAARITFTI